MTGLQPCRYLVSGGVGVWYLFSIFDQIDTGGMGCVT